MPANILKLIAILEKQQVQVVNFHHYLHWGVNALRQISMMPGLRVYLTLHEYLGICANHGQMVTSPNGTLCMGAVPSTCASCVPNSTVSAMKRRSTLFKQNFLALAGFISPSKFLRQRYVDWGIKGRPIQVIENGLIQTQTSASIRPFRRGNNVVFGYFGQINPFKGVDILLEAARQIARINVSAPIEIRIHGNIIGQSESFQVHFDRTIEEHSMLRYFGAYRNSDVHDLMAACDAIVVPSKWWENSPVVIQEAYAARVPVICSNIGGLAEKVRNNITGLHFQFNDPNSLASVMSHFASAKLSGKSMNIFPPVTSSSDMAKAYLDFFAATREN